MYWTISTKTKPHDYDCAGSVGKLSPIFIVRGKWWV